MTVMRALLHQATDAPRGTERGDLMIVVDPRRGTGQEEVVGCDLPKRQWVSPRQPSPSWKNGRAKAVRFSTLDAICRILECQPGDILVVGFDDAGG